MKIAVLLAVLVFVSSQGAAASPVAEMPGFKRAKCRTINSPVLARVKLADGRVARLTPGALRIGDRVITRCDGLPGGHPQALVATDHDIVIGFRDASAQRFDGTSFTAVAGLPKTPIRALAYSKDSGLWIGTATQGLWHEDGSGTATQHPHSVLGKGGITALKFRASALHVGLDPRGHWKIHDEKVIKLSNRSVGCFAPSTRIVARSPGQACRPGSHSSRSQLHVTAMTRHRGQLIVSTFDRGLYMRLGARFEPIVDAPRFINALLSVDDDLFIGTAEGLYRWENDSQTIKRVALGLPSNHVNALALGKKGTLWIATSRGVAGLDRGRVRLLGEAHGLPSAIAYSLAVTDDNALWIGTAAGAIRLLGQEQTLFTQANGRLPHDWVTALWAHGSLVYAGTYDAGVARLAPSGASSTLAGLEHAWVNPAGITMVDGVLAVATLGDGLWFHNGISAERAPRLPSDDVTAILRDGKTVWAGTRGGLATLHGPETP